MAVGWSDPRTNGSARRAAQKNWWSRTDCTHCRSVTNEAAQPPQTSTQEKIDILEKTLAVMGNEETILAGRKLLEKEPDWHQKKLKGPNNTAKQIEAEQNWINKETKRIETEVEKLVEMQESIKTRKGALRVAYAEIKKL